MEELRNLQQIYSLAAGRFNQYEGKDFVLPEVFKEQVREINSNLISYNKYSAIIETRGNQNGVLNIFLPNQWFYIASYFTDFYNELQRYKKEALKVVSKERLKELNGASLTNLEIERVNRLSLNETSKNYLVRFMTDYSWWSGAKTIDRGDFYVSPILNSARLVNASQSFVADLCAFLANKQELVQAIILGEEDTLNSNKHLQTIRALQQIFYGAPGTGKSHKVNDLTSEAEKEERVFRTTFHPDSDYSTFVGAYKPSMDGPHNIKLDMSFDDLSTKLNEYYNDPDTGKIEGIQKFCQEFYRYIDGEYMAVSSDKLVKKAGISDNYAREIDKYVNFMQLLPKQHENKIIYTFVPQSFTNAYVKAWNTTDDVFLIIEEINRGNCAQIFGDLFQLLDRKNGISEYPVDADSDLKDYINTELQNSPRTDFPKGVKEGKKLVLPSNLYIWATMNTSDQSLFPIDSAFKRRWEWKYIPIKNHEDKNYKIGIGESKYDWWDFLRKINQVINVTTNSEDKKLGYFFVKTEDGKITAEQFVGKVLFYLWNDVFKNYGFDNSIFDKEDKKKFEFSDFFDDNGDPNTDMVNRFLVKLDETIDKEHSFIETAISDTNNPQNSENTENSGDTENTDM